MGNIVSAVFNEWGTKTIKDLWQYDYGQILRIEGLNLPKAVEIHFSLQETGGEAKRRIGITESGVTDVVIPDFILEGNKTTRDYYAYAFIYVADEESGETTHKIKMSIKSRPEPEGNTGTDDTSFGAIMAAVNKIAESAVSDEKIKNTVNEYLEKNPINIKVDSEISSESENPVQNKAVAKRFSQLSKHSIEEMMGANILTTTDKTIVGAINEINKKSAGGVTSWDDLEDRPFYEGVGEVEIFPSTELTLPDELGSISFPDPSEIGIEYFLYIGDTVIKGTSQYIGMPYMSNGVVFEDGSRSCWGIFEPSETLSSMSGTYTVKVATTQSLVVPLDSKYLPQSVPSIAEFVENGNVVCVQRFDKNGLPKSWKTINIKDLVIPFIHYVIEDKRLTVAVENSETIVFENVDITRRFAIEIVTGSSIPNRAKIYLYCGDTYDVPSASIVTKNTITGKNMIFCNRIYHGIYISEITSTDTIASSIDRESFTTNSTFNITKIVIQDTEGGELFTGEYDLLYF